MAEEARRHVAKYEPLLEVITDKVNAEVPSPFEGILTEILVEEGATVPNNAEIAVIETADEAGAGRTAAAAAAAAPARRQRAAVDRSSASPAGPAPWALRPRLRQPLGTGRLRRAAEAHGRPADPRTAPPPRPGDPARRRRTRG